MPLIIGEIHAHIEVESRKDVSSPATDQRDEEKRRTLAIAAERFARERQIDQRDPDLLGGH